MFSFLSQTECFPSYFKCSTNIYNVILNIPKEGQAIMNSVCGNLKNSKCSNKNSNF